MLQWKELTSKTNGARASFASLERFKHTWPLSMCTESSEWGAPFVFYSSKWNSYLSCNWKPHFNIFVINTCPKMLMHLIFITKLTSFVKKPSAKTARSRVLCNMALSMRSSIIFYLHVLLGQFECCKNKNRRSCTMSLLTTDLWPITPWSTSIVHSFTLAFSVMYDTPVVQRNESRAIYIRVSRDHFCTAWFVSVTVKRLWHDDPFELKKLVLAHYHPGLLETNPSIRPFSQRSRCEFM